MSRILLLIPSALLGLASLNSCSEEKIRTYKIATDSTADVPAVAPTLPSPDNSAKSVTWEAPGDWKEETPGQFQTALFRVGTSGRVSVSRLPGDGGGIPANINRWRRQMGLDALSDKDIVGQPLKVTGGENEMLLFNLVPKDAPADSDAILAAILPLKSESWYFKFNGPAGQMNPNGRAFMKFLMSVRVAGESAPVATPPAATDAAPKIQFATPEGWTPSQGSSMRVASFSVAGADGATADVSVVPLPGDAGSVLDNVNRWRAQVQLPPIDSPDDPALGTKVDGPAGSFFLSHMVSTVAIPDGGKKTAISAAILKTAGQTWFFKITGEASLVEANRGKFEAFVRSATFP